LANSRSFPYIVLTKFACGFLIYGYKLKCILVMQMWIQCRENQLHVEQTGIVHTTSGGISTVKFFFPCTVQTDVLAANI